MFSDSEYYEIDFGNLNEQESVQKPTLPQEPTKKKKAKLVKFDTNTQNPFEVLFSERGFSIDGTRMSFEFLKTALSKNLNIVLDSGNGIVLDAVKMQKILKYEE